MGSIRKKKDWWYYRYYENGKLREIALHTKSEELAKRYKTILDAQKGNLREQLNANFGQVIEQYLQFLFPQKSTHAIRTYTLCAKRLKPYYDLPIRKIGTTQILQIIKNLESYLSKESVRKTVMFIKQVFRWAANYGYISYNPAEEIKYSTGKKKKRIRWFTKDELIKIFDYADEHFPKFSPVFKFLYYTGMRLSEVVALQWQDVDFKNKMIRVVDSKTPSGFRRIPMRPEVEKILKNLPRKENNKFVFAGTKNKSWNSSHLTHIFKEILKKVGINEPGVCLHTLRHTFASHLAMSGVSLDVIRDLLGHSSVVITEIYAHLAPDHIQEAIRKLPSLEKENGGS